jgi:hypothetical protein
MNAPTPARPERHTGPEGSPIGPSGEQPDTEPGSDPQDEEDEEYEPL